MEELPDEVALLVLRHIEPLSDTAAVSRTCRRWRGLMLDPHLWALFYQRTFPTTTTATGTPEGDATGAAATNTNWRLSFADRAKKLRRALRCAEDVKLARVAGCNALVQLLAAADAGCLPLAERALAEVLTAYGGDEDRVIRIDYLGRPLDLALYVIDECLHRACAIGSVPVAQLLLGLANYEHDGYHRNAAVRSGNQQLVRLLLKAKIKPDNYNSWRRCLTQVAAERGDTEMLKLLLDHGEKPFKHYDISNAARYGSIECVQLLIDRGFCTPPRGAHNDDLVGRGVESGNVDVVRLLRNQHYELDSTHVVIALSQAKSPSTDMLLELIPALEEKHWFACLTSPTLSSSGDVTVCRFLIEHGGVNIDVVDPREERTALHHAIESSCVALAQCLLACGARTDIRAPGLAGLTALGMARQYNTPAARLVVEHSNKRTRANKRRRKSSSTSDSGAEEAKKTQASPDGIGDGEADTTSKQKANKKQKKEPAAEKLQEKELEAEVRQLAKLDDKAKLDVFTLRRMLRSRGVLAGDIPTRKLALLQLAIDWLRAGN